MTESAKTLAALRRQIAALDDASPPRGRAKVATGHASLDSMLDGGLARGRLHELFGNVEDEGAASGLALLFARLVAGNSSLFWLRTAAAGRQGGWPYGPGLAALGVDPAQLLVGVMKDDAMLLRAAVDALRCSALGALVIEMHGPAPLLDLTASRRLALAAEGSDVTALLLRIGGEPVPSAADTRWRVAAAPSVPLPGNAPGMSAFDLTLLRRRAGRDGMTWRLVWNAERGAFEEDRHERDEYGEGGGERGEGAAISGVVVSLSSDQLVTPRAA